MSLLKKPFYFSLSVLSLLLLACSSGPKAIEYGSDACYSCKMTIVDRLHAAELVTDKGKVYKFDAIECMMHHRKEIDISTVESYHCNHFSTPIELINAEEAFYLISKNLPSPMGAYLTAFSSEQAAQQALQEYGGQIYSWQQLQNHFNN